MRYALMIISFCLFNIVFACEINTPEKLSNEITTRFISGQIATMDKLQVPRMRRIVIQHSLRYGLPVENHHSYTETAKWLKTDKEIESFNHKALEFRWCKKGVCLYEAFNGISHNTLYIKHIYYRFDKNHCPYVDTIVFMSGD